MSLCEVVWPRRFAASLICAAMLAGLLTGCGFQARGTRSFPPELAVTFVEAADRYSPFYQELLTSLRQNNVTVAKASDEARAVIKVLTDDTGRRLLSVTAGNVPAEYEVYYAIRFAVYVDGREVVPVESLVLTRDFSFDERQVLGKAEEEGILRRALAEDLVGLVGRRLAAIR